MDRIGFRHPKGVRAQYDGRGYVGSGGSGGTIPSDRARPGHRGGSLASRLIRGATDPAITMGSPCMQCVHSGPLPVFNKCVSRRDVQQARAVRGRRVRPRTPVIRDLSIVAKARALAAEQVELTHPHATSAFDLWRNPRHADRRANRSRSLTAHGSHTKGVRQLLA